MDFNKYRYLFIDGSFMLKRHNYMESKSWIDSGRDDSTYTVGNVARRYIYSLNKLARDIGGADKIITLWDMWDGGNGYYSTQILKGKYKDSRVYETEEDANKPDLTDEERRKILDNVKRNSMQTESKRFIINNLGSFGFPSVRYSGYEADSLSYIYSSILAFSDKPSCIASSDGDWGYNVSPKVHFCKVGMRGNETKVFTYNELSKDIDEDIVGKVSLYDWKSYYDSIEGSHNDMRRTRRDNFNTRNIINNIILRGDYSGIEDMDLFNLQYSTFKIERFPGFNRIIDEFNSKLNLGKIASLEEFKLFNNDNNLGISDKWYNSLSDRLDHSLYKS